MCVLGNFPLANPNGPLAAQVVPKTSTRATTRRPSWSLRRLSQPKYFCVWWVKCECRAFRQSTKWIIQVCILLVIIEKEMTPTRALGATARSYRRQDGADAAARFEKFLPARASLRPPISLKFTTEKHGGMVHLAPKRQNRICSRFSTMIPERFAARRR